MTSDDLLEEILDLIFQPQRTDPYWSEEPLFFQIYIESIIRRYIEDGNEVSDNIKQLLAKEGLMP